MSDGLTVVNFSLLQITLHQKSLASIPLCVPSYFLRVSPQVELLVWMLTKHHQPEKEILFKGNEFSVFHFLLLFEITSVRKS